MSEGLTTAAEGMPRFARDEVREGEVYDRRLDIYWREKAERGGDKALLELTWSEALAHAWREVQKDGEGRLWRLPTVEELSSLVEMDGDGTSYPFWLPEREGWWWSSTPVAGGAGLAWVVGFDHGVVDRDGRGLHGRVRLVRGASRSVI